MKHILLLTVLVVGLEARASEHMNHAEILKKIPEAFLAYVGGAVPDRNGLVGHNREGFKASALQRGATLTLAIAAARGDRKRADDCWRAVDATFAHQTEEGHFGDPATSVAQRNESGYAEPGAGGYCLEDSATTSAVIRLPLQGERSGLAAVGLLLSASRPYRFSKGAPECRVSPIIGFE